MGGTAGRLELIEEYWSNIAIRVCKARKFKFGH